MAANEFITKFGADTTEFVNGMNVMDKSVEKSVSKTDSAFAGLGKKLAGYLSFAVLAKTVNDAINYFDNLQHKAEQLGMSASFLGAFEDGMRAVGGSTQGADAALSSLLRKWGEAQTGGGELVTLLNKIGISTKNTDDTFRTGEQALYLFADAIKNATDPAEKLFISTKAFGEENGVRMVEVLKDGAEGLAAMRAQFELANPELDKHAKSLSEAKQNLTDMWEGIIIFAGGFVGKIKEVFGGGLDAVIDAAISKTDSLYLVLLEMSNKLYKAMSFGKINLDKLVEDERKKLDDMAKARQEDLKRKQEERKANETDINNELVKQSDAYKKLLEEIERLRKDEAKRAREADAQARAIEARLDAFFGDIDELSSRRYQEEKAVIMALIQQGNTLDQIALRYPNLKSGIEAAKTEYEKAAEAAAKITEGVEKATEATRKLAEEAGNVSYPDPSGSTGGKPNLLSDQGTYKKGGGVGGSFVGMNADLSGVSVSELLRMADELAEKKMKYSQSAGGQAGILGGINLNEMYSKTIQNILDNINKELYYRAQEEAGSNAGMVPKAGFSTPEQYFKRLDDFIEKLYEKEKAKDITIDRTTKTTEAASDATKKLASALDRFSGSLERSVGYVGRFRT